LSYNLLFGETDREIAKVAELVDAPALGAGAERRESSSLSFRTNALWQGTDET
jgi:hypothetical protein